MKVLIAFLLAVLTLCKGLQIGVVRPQDTDTTIQKRSDNDRSIQMHDIGFRNYYSKPGSEALVEQKDLNIFETRAPREIFEARLSTSPNNEKSDGGSLGLELTFNTGFNIGLRLRPTRTKQRIKKILFYVPKKVIDKTQRYLSSLKDSNGSYSDDDLLYSDESASCSGTCYESGQSIRHSNSQTGNCKQAIKSSAPDEESVPESFDQHNEEDCHFFSAFDEDQNEYSTDEESKKDFQWEETLQKEEYQTDDEDAATSGYQSDEEYAPAFAHHIAVLSPALKNPDSKIDIFRKIESEIGFFSVSPQSFEDANSMGSVIRPASTVDRVELGTLSSHLLQNSYLNAYKKVAALPEVASNTAEGPEFDKESNERTLNTEDRHSSGEGDSKSSSAEEPEYVLVSTSILMNRICEHLPGVYQSENQVMGKYQEILLAVFKDAPDEKERSRIARAEHKTFFPGPPHFSVSSKITWSAGMYLLGPILAAMML